MVNALEGFVTPGETCGLSNMGVVGNERFRSRGWHWSGEDKGLSGFSKFRWDWFRRGEDVTTVLIRGWSPDASKLVQAFLDTPVARKTEDLFREFGF